MMERRQLGGTGLTVSALGFGCGSVGGLMVRGDPAEQRRAVARALAAGVTYFDTAPQYGNGRSEENLGRVLHELGGWDQVVAGTKVRLAAEELADPGTAIRRSLEQSLRRLGRDVVDILQLHNPVVSTAQEEGAAVPLDQALAAVCDGLTQVVRDGLARNAGFTGLGDTEAIHGMVRSGRFATMQGYVNAANPSAGFAGASGGEQDFAGSIGVAAAAGMGVIAIRVLAAGALTASAERPANAGGGGPPLARGGTFEHDLERAQALAALAADLGLEGPTELAVRFSLSVPGVSTVLVGYSNLEHLEQAIRWAERGPLAEEALQRVVALAR
jgi:aryl-alcohol dehydrogenase-like predicted oxidoreductase